jgi:hypothetical protein
MFEAITSLHSSPPSVLIKKRAGDRIDPSALRKFLCALRQRVVFAQRLEV